MKPSSFLVAALAIVPGAMAVDQMKNIIVWAQDDTTTDAMIEKAKSAILEAGGKVTHVYSTLIRYVAYAPDERDRHRPLVNPLGYEKRYV